LSTEGWGEAPAVGDLVAYSDAPWIVTDIEDDHPGTVWVLRPLYGGGSAEGGFCRVRRPEIEDVRLVHRRGDWSPS
jgi:hypothetical protein